jgi:replication factor C subunit 2/4
MTETTLPWIEKYRPLVLDDIVGNNEAVKRMKQIALEGNIPHLILSGSSGIGKTTASLCLARQLLGDELLKVAWLEVNASDERRVENIRTKIKTFAQKNVVVPNNGCKIVFLDESDSMTTSAQQTLRLIMSNNQSTTRFIFACNDSTCIIESIQSQCTIIRFQALSQSEMKDRIIKIIQLEGVKYTEGGLKALLYIAEGDLRVALNYLQSAACGLGELNEDNLFKICDRPQPLVVRNMINACLHDDFDTATKTLIYLIQKGYCASDIVKSMAKVTSMSHELFNGTRIQLLFINKIGEALNRVVNGVNSPLQLSGLIASLCLIGDD